jgi:protein TonB
LLHIGFYHHFAHTASAEKNKPLPILIEFIHPAPKPPAPAPVVEPKIVPPKPLEPPKPKKPLPKPQKVVQKKIVKRAIQKARLQQKSLVQVQADEVVEKEVAERPQQITEAVVKKPDNKPEEVAPEPEHEAVITKAGYGGCRSALNRYPSSAREQGLEGTVKIKVRVLADGSVANASVIKSSGESILDESALENVRDCEFEPAQKDGVPMASTVVIPIRFKLD